LSVFFGSTLALLTIVVVVEGVALLSLMRQIGTVLSHVAPPRPGSLEGGPQEGQQIPEPLREDIRGKQGGLFVFLGVRCPSCKPVEEVLGTVVEHYPELSLVPIVLGDFLEQREEHAEQLAVPARSDCQDLALEWSIPGTPYAVGVTADYRVVRAGVVNSLDQLEALAELVTDDHLHQGRSVDADENDLVAAQVHSDGKPAYPEGRRL
jgi:hypothetical protein